MKTVQTEIICLLEQHYLHSKDPCISRRAHACILSEKGYHFDTIRDILMISERTLERWLKRYIKLGICSIFPGYYNNQNASKLTREEKMEIKDQLEKDPLPVQYWTCEGLQSYLSARFDIEYKSKQSFYAILKFCNYSYKLPSLFDIRRNDAVVEERIKEIREEIKDHFSDPDCEIFVSDETRIEWDTLTRRSWLQKGKKTIIKEHRDRKYQSFIGFLNLKTGKQYLNRLDWQDQEHIIPTLENLQNLFPNKKLYIIWDNAGFHRGQLIRDNLGQGNKLERITLINMPPYAPDKNPQEHVWRYVKDHLSNEVFNDFSQMVETFERIAMGRIFNFKI